MLPMNVRSAELLVLPKSNIRASNWTLAGCPSRIGDFGLPDEDLEQIAFFSSLTVTRLIAALFEIRRSHPLRPAQ